ANWCWEVMVECVGSGVSGGKWREKGESKVFRLAGNTVLCTVFENVGQGREETMSIPHNNQGPPPAGPPPQNDNGPPPVMRPNGPAPDLRSMEKLWQPSINGRGGPIASIPIQAMDFRLRHHMIQQVQNSYQFHGLLGDDANRHINKFLEVTQYMKQNGVSDDAIRLSLFPYSLTHHATA
nr:reverse transcriptase domain-containing protein [Tanacetum cinerariifolium]